MLTRSVVNICKARSPDLCIAYTIGEWCLFSSRKLATQQVDFELDSDIVKKFQAYGFFGTCHYSYFVQVYIEDYIFEKFYAY